MIVLRMLASGREASKDGSGDVRDFRTYAVEGFTDGLQFRFETCNCESPTLHVHVRQTWRGVLLAYGDVEMPRQVWGGSVAIDLVCAGIVKTRLMAQQEMERHRVATERSLN